MLKFNFGLIVWIMVGLTVSINAKDHIDHTSSAWDDETVEGAIEKLYGKNIELIESDKILVKVPKILACNTSFPVQIKTGIKAKSIALFQDISHDWLSKVLKIPYELCEGVGIDYKYSKTRIDKCKLDKKNMILSRVGFTKSLVAYFPIHNETSINYMLRVFNFDYSNSVIVIVEGEDNKLYVQRASFECAMGPWHNDNVEDWKSKTKITSKNNDIFYFRSKKVPEELTHYPKSYPMITKDRGIIQHITGKLNNDIIFECYINKDQKRRFPMVNFRLTDGKKGDALEMNYIDTQGNSEIDTLIIE